MPFNFPDYGWTKRKKWKWKCSSFSAPLMLLERAEAKVCRLKLMQLYCYRCLWSAYFVSLMKYSMWKFLSIVLLLHKGKSTKHAKSNFASETIFCSSKSTSERQWHVKLSTENKSCELKTNTKKKTFSFVNEKREKQLIMFCFCCTLFGPVFRKLSN